MANSAGASGYPNNLGHPNLGHPSNMGNLPSFQRKRPNIRLNWELVGNGPGRGEKAMVSFLKQGFFLAIKDQDDNTMSLCFVPRPKFKNINGRTIVEAESGADGDPWMVVTNHDADRGEHEEDEV